MKPHFSRVSLFLALVGTFFPDLQASGQGLTEARALLRSGDYESALDALGDLRRGSGSTPEVEKSYARALAETGQYEQALRALSGAGGGAPAIELENTRGEILFTLGRLAEAEAAFRRAMEGSASDAHQARKNLGVLLWDRGEREAALALFDSFIDLYNGSSASLSAEELEAVGVAVRYLGVTNPDLFQDALMAFDEAAAADPDAFGPPLLVGELFLEKYRATDARESLGIVLEQNPRHPRALLGQARVLDFEGVWVAPWK